MGFFENWDKSPQKKWDKGAAGIKLTIYPRIGYTVFPFSGGRIYNHAGCRLTPPEGMLKNKEIKDEKINGGLLCDVCFNCA